MAKKKSGSAAKVKSKPAAQAEPGCESLPPPVPPIPPVPPVVLGSMAIEIPGASLETLVRVDIFGNGTISAAGVAVPLSSSNAFADVWARCYDTTDPIPAAPPTTDPACVEGTIITGTSHWEFRSGDGNEIPVVAYANPSSGAPNVLVVWVQFGAPTTGWCKSTETVYGLTSNRTDLDP